LALHGNRQIGRLYGRQVARCHRDGQVVTWLRCGMVSAIRPRDSRAVPDAGRIHDMVHAGTLGEVGLCNLPIARDRTPRQLSTVAREGAANRFLAGLNRTTSISRPLRCTTKYPCDPQRTQAIYRQARSTQRRLSPPARLRVSLERYLGNVRLVCRQEMGKTGGTARKNRRVGQLHGLVDRTQTDRSKAGFRATMKGIKGSHRRATVSVHLYLLRQHPRSGPICRHAPVPAEGDS
jgi:hypothetical protein